MIQTKTFDEKLKQAINDRDTGAWKKAVLKFKSLTVDYPESADVYAHLAHTYVRQRRYSKAIETFQHALNLDPHNANALIQLGKTYCQLGEFNLSETCFLNAEQENLTDQEKDLVAQWQQNLDEYKSKLSRLSINLNLNAKDMGVALYQKANELCIAGNLEEAVEAYELAAKCRVDYSDPAINLGATISTHSSRMPSGEYYSCSWLEEGLHFHDDRLTFCCTAHSVNKGWTKIGQFNGGKLPIDFVLAKRALVSKQLMNNQENNCSGCPALQKKAWPKTEYHFAHLIFNNFSVCNFRCTYCSLTHQNFEMPAYYFSAETAVNDILNNDWLKPGGTTTWGGGDPSVSVEFRNLLHKLIDHGSFNIINTNAAIFIKDIETALLQRKANLVVSIDAGTRATFDAVKFGNEDASQPTLIKGKPALDAVWETLGKYIDAWPEAVVVKYIVDLNNAGFKEIELFIEHCVKHNVKKLMFTPEAEFIRQIPITRALLPERIFEAIAYGTELALNNHIECVFDQNVYSEALFSPEARTSSLKIIAKAI